jgi:hypothetical protein
MGQMAAHMGPDRSGVAVGEATLAGVTTRVPDSASVSPVRVHRVPLPAPAAQLLLALLLGIAVRLFVLLRSRGMLDGDEATLGIQAEQILHGAHPIYFAGQAYMGSWDAYLAAPLVALFGPSAWLLHGIMLVESLALIPLLGALAVQIYGERARWPAYLLAALPPLYVAIGELRMLGGYIETLVLGTALLLVVMRLARAWRSGERTVRLWALAGTICGLGVWIDELIVYYVAAAALWLLPLAALEVRRRWGDVRAFDALRAVVMSVAAAGLSFVVGAAPAILYALRHGPESVQAVFYHIDGIAALGPLRIRVLEHFVQVDAQQAIGMRLLWGIPANGLTLVIGWVSLVVALGALANAVRRSVARPLTARVPAGRVDRREAAPLERWHSMLPLLLVVTTAVIFWRSNAVVLGVLATGLDLTGRYALPLTTAAVPMLAGLVVDVPTLIARGKWAMSPRKGRPPHPGARSARWANVVGGALLTAVLLAYAVPYGLADEVQAMQSPYFPHLRFPAEGGALASYLEQHHIQYVWSDHWIGDVVMYLSDGRVVCADYVDVVIWKGVNRFPLALDTVAQADRPSFILESAGEPHLARLFDRTGVTYTSAHFGQLWVITPTSRTVRPDEALLEVMQDY